MMKRLLLLLVFPPLLHAEAPEAPVEEMMAGPQTDAFEQMARFTLALEQIRHLYVQSGEEVSYETLIDGAIEGMTGRLDRYSTYLEGRDAEEMREQTRGRFGGVGIVISLENGALTIVSPVMDRKSLFAL